MNTARALAIACACAVAATVGDALLLWAGNARRVDLQIVHPPEFVLTIGGVLGCMAIPLYAMGYLAVARMIRPRRPTAAKVVALGGAVFALAGALTHGLTWMAIRSSVIAGTASAPPVEAVAASSGLLLDVWIAAAVLMLVVSIAIARVGFSLPRAIPTWLAWSNPVNIALVLSAAGAVTELGRAFLVPAAPNVAHIIFFAAALYASTRSPAHGADSTR